MFFINRDRVSALAARYAIPAIYSGRFFFEAGGLMAYAPDALDGYRQTGVCTGRVLSGEAPADLPVLQSTNVFLSLNLKVAKALGITFPTSLLVRRGDRMSNCDFIAGLGSAVAWSASWPLAAHAQRIHKVYRIAWILLALPVADMNESSGRNNRALRFLQEEGTGLTFEQMLEQAGELDYSERSSGGMMTYAADGIGRKRLALIKRDGSNLGTTYTQDEAALINSACGYFPTMHINPS